MHGSSRGLNRPRFYDFLLFLMTRGRERHYRDRLLELAGVKPGQHLLDIGCGTGTTAIAAARRVQPGGMVCGVDVSPRMIAAAQCKSRELCLRFQVSDAVALPFSDGLFDTVLLTTVLHMVPGPERGTVLREVCRVLRPGGRLLVVDYGGAQRHGLVAKHRLHRAFDIETMQPLLMQAGLTPVEGGPTGWLDLQYIAARKS